MKLTLQLSHWVDIRLIGESESAWVVLTNEITGIRGSVRITKEQLDSIAPGLKPGESVEVEVTRVGEQAIELCGVCSHSRHDHDDGEGYCRGADSDGCTCPGFVRERSDD